MLPDGLCCCETGAEGSGERAVCSPARQWAERGSSYPDASHRAYLAGRTGIDVRSVALPQLTVTSGGVKQLPWSFNTCVHRPGQRLLLSGTFFVWNPFI